MPWRNVSRFPERSLCVAMPRRLEESDPSSHPPRSQALLGTSGLGRRKNHAGVQNLPKLSAPQWTCCAEAQSQTHGAVWVRILDLHLQREVSFRRFLSDLGEAVEQFGCRRR